MASIENIRPEISIEPPNYEERVQNLIKVDKIED